MLVGVLLLTSTGFAFDKGDGRDTLPIKNKTTKSESRTSRSFAFDNDILVPGSRSPKGHTLFKVLPGCSQGGSSQGTHAFPNELTNRVPMSVCPEWHRMAVAQALGDVTNFSQRIRTE